MGKLSPALSAAEHSVSSCNDVTKQAFVTYAEHSGQVLP